MARGGKRPGAGRKKGKTAATLEREAVDRAVKQKILGVAEGLIARGMALAIGSTYLYKIEKEWVETGKNKGYWKKSKPILVKNQEEIEAYLEKTVTNEDESDEEDTTYYFITTDKPDRGAIGDMLDRALGRAPQSIAVTTNKSMGELLDEAEKSQ